MSSESTGTADGLADIDQGIDVSNKEYTERRRHKAINDARDQVRKSKLRIFEALAEGDIGRTRASLAARQTVEVLIHEIMPLLKEHGEEYLEEREIGTMRLDIPSEATAGSFQSGLEHAKTEFPAVTFRGLQSIIEAPDFVVGRYVIQHRDPIHGTRTTAQTVREPIPKSIINTAHNVTSEFLDEIGFGAGVHDDGDAGFDYSDILEEGPPGTGEVPDIEGVEQS